MQPNSPEERLLNLIKGKHKRKSGLGEQSPIAKNSLLAKFIKKIFLKSKIFKPSFLKSINRVLPVVLLILSGYLIYSLLFTAQKDISSIVQEREALFPDVSIELQEEPLLLEVEEYSFYADQIGGKKLFEPPIIEGPPKDKHPTLDISKRFNLVGIVAGKEPQAIIEDSQTRKTHYLYKGQFFNGFTVEDIGEGKVVLNYEGKKIILVL